MKFFKFFIIKTERKILKSFKVIDTSKLNNSIVFSRAIFGVLKAKGTRVEGRGYGPRAEGQGTQTPENNMIKLVVDI